MNQSLRNPISVRFKWVVGGGSGVPACDPAIWLASLRLHGNSPEIGAQSQSSPRNSLGEMVSSSSINSSSSSSSSSNSYNIDTIGDDGGDGGGQQATFGTLYPAAAASTVVVVVIIYIS
ncbi:hypothetical protein M0804_014436 [Polistes exclamans]|nr:hypothetical protein M0804_014438 [Polistes exclamans]KAI4475224.1 hypothetical protein M0804_014436 [Polistes exclamans]